MTRIPPIGSSVTAGRVVSKIKNQTRTPLPKEMPLPDNKEQELINILHPATPFFNAKRDIQTSLARITDSFKSKND